METKYTPEPWFIERDTDTVRAGPQTADGLNPDAIEIFCFGFVDEPGGRQDAERVVACVNACAGIENPAALPALFDAIYRLSQVEPGVLEIHGVTKALAALRGAL